MNPETVKEVIKKEAEKIDAIKKDTLNEFIFLKRMDGLLKKYPELEGASAKATWRKIKQTFRSAGNKNKVLKRHLRNLLAIQELDIPPKYKLEINRLLAELKVIYDKITEYHTNIRAVLAQYETYKIQASILSIEAKLKQQSAVLAQLKSYLTSNINNIKTDIKNQITWYIDWEATFKAHGINIKRFNVYIDTNVAISLHEDQLVRKKGVTSLNFPAKAIMMPARLKQEYQRSRSGTKRVPQQMRNYLFGLPNFQEVETIMTKSLKEEIRRAFNRSRTRKPWSSFSHGADIELIADAINRPNNSIIITNDTEIEYTVAELRRSYPKIKVFGYKEGNVVPLIN
jgi:hypothetical protein